MRTLVSNVFPDLLKGLRSPNLTSDCSAKCVVAAILSDPRWVCGWW